MNRLFVALWSLLEPFCLLPDWPSFSCCVVVVVEVTAVVAEFPLAVIRRFFVVRPSSLGGAVTEWTWEEILACFFFAVTEDFATFDPPSSAGVESLELSVTWTFFNALSFAIIVSVSSLELESELDDELEALRLLEVLCFEAALQETCFVGASESEPSPDELDELELSLDEWTTALSTLPDPLVAAAGSSSEELDSELELGELVESPFLMVLRLTWACSGPESSLNELELEAFFFEPEFAFWAGSGFESLLDSEDELDFEEALFDESVRLPSGLGCADIFNFCLTLGIGSQSSLIKDMLM